MENEKNILKKYPEYITAYTKYIEEYRDQYPRKIVPEYPFGNYKYLCEIYPNGEVYDARTEIKTVQKQIDNCSYKGGHDLVTFAKKNDNTALIKRIITENVEKELELYKNSLNTEKKKRIVDKIVDKLLTPFSESDKTLKDDGCLSAKGKKELSEYVKKYMVYVNSVK